MISITRGLVLAEDGTGRLLARNVERWTDIAQALDRHVRSLTTRSDIAGFLESMLLRWSPALLLLLGYWSHGWQRSNDASLKSRLIA